MSDRETILKNIDAVRHQLTQKIMSCHDAGLERQADQYSDWDQLLIECFQHIRADAPSPLSQWTDRDVLIGDVRFKAGSITISDVVDHAARAAAEFYDDDEPLSEADQRKIDAAWEIHKAAAPVEQPGADPTVWISRADLLTMQDGEVKFVAGAKGGRYDMPLYAAPLPQSAPKTINPRRIDA